MLRKSCWITWISLVVAVLGGLAFWHAKVNERQLEAELSSPSLLTDGLCLPFETFDSSEKVCRAHCISIHSCAQLERNYRRTLDVLSLADLKLYFGFYEVPFDSSAGVGAQERYTTPLDPNAVRNQTFAIREGQLREEIDRIGDPHYGRTPSELWSLFSTLVPLRYKGFIDQFLMVNDPDQTLGNIAWVISDSTTTWQVGLNADSVVTQDGVIIDRGNAIHTFIHELGHLITLDIDQVNPDPVFAATSICTTIVLPEGCPYANSYIAQFVKQFWPALYGHEEQPSGEFVKGNFVSGYAADNPSEDIAETWTAFVLYPKPVGFSIAEKKILFFYGFPELVAARSEIRLRLGAVR